MWHTNTCYQAWNQATLRFICIIKEFWAEKAEGLCLCFQNGAVAEKNRETYAKAVLYLVSWRQL